MAYQEGIINETCERINETFVVKCVETIKEPLEVVVEEFSNPVAVSIDQLSKPIDIAIKSLPHTPFLSLDASDLISIVVSLVAAFAAYYSSQAAKNSNSIAQSQMKPWPIISNDISDVPYLKEGESYHNMTISLENIGNGPLIIERLDIYVNNKPIIENNNMVQYDRKSPTDFITEQYRSSINGLDERKGLHSLLERNREVVTLLILPKDTGIAADSAKTLISFPLSEHDVNSGKYEKLYRSTKIKCEYKDIYGKVFYFSTDI